METQIQGIKLRLYGTNLLEFKKNYIKYFFFKYKKLVLYTFNALYLSSKFFNSICFFVEIGQSKKIGKVKSDKCYMPLNGIIQEWINQETEK